jgi:hypothetical protein
LTAATGCQGSFEDLWQIFRVNQGSPILVDEDVSKHFQKDRDFIGNIGNIGPLESLF